MSLTSEEEDVTEDTSEEDYHSCEEDESLIGSNSDQTEEGEPSSNLNTTSNTDTSDKEEETEVAYSSENTDGSVNERCLLISSAANIRRREMQGQGYFYKEDRKEVPKERKKKLTKKRPTKKENLASLEDLRKEVKKALGADTRGLKKKKSKEGRSQCRKVANLRNMKGNC